MHFSHPWKLRVLFFITTAMISTCTSSLSGPPGTDGTPGQMGLQGPAGPQGPSGASAYQDGTTVVHIFLTDGSDGFSTPIGFYNTARQEPCVWRAVNNSTVCVPSTEKGYFLYQDSACQNRSVNYLYLGHPNVDCAPHALSYLSVNEATTSCISFSEHIFKVQLVENNTSVGSFYVLQTDSSGFLHCVPLIMSVGHYPIYQILNEVDVSTLPVGSVNY